MSVKNIVAAALLAGSVLAASAPASAVTTSFANFNTLTSASNIYWKNGNNTNTSKNGQIYTIASGSSTVPGATVVSFNFLVGGLPTGIRANWTLFGTTTNTAAIMAGSCPGPACFLIQQNITGSFSYVAKAAGSATSQTIGAYTIPDGTVIFGATNYTGALIAGVRGGSSAAFTGTDPVGGSITYVSDPMFGLDFSTTTARDFSITLGSIGQAGSAASQVGFNAKNYTSLVPTAALTTFRASANGTFGSEPSPSVPEPATWALFVAGFGMVGFQVRRRRQLASVAG